MQGNRKTLQLAFAALLLFGVACLSIPSGALAQTATPGASVSLTESTIKALQQALNSQGIPVTANGILNEETRAAVRKYQTQHHLPATGDPDKATLDKLGVRVSAVPNEQTTAQAPSPPPAGTMPPQSGGMMMNCPMMQGQMAAMMQMMQSMMQMMQTMQGQMQPSQMPTSPMGHGQMMTPGSR